MKILVTDDTAFTPPASMSPSGSPRRSRRCVGRGAGDGQFRRCPFAHASPFRSVLRQVSERRFAVRGTPTDCVIMAYKEVLGGGPISCFPASTAARTWPTTSPTPGTVAGAMEGTLLGIPSIALSQAYGFETRDSPIWETAEDMRQKSSRC